MVLGFGDWWFWNTCCLSRLLWRKNLVWLWWIHTSVHRYKNTTPLDYSTCFLWSVSLSVFLSSELKPLRRHSAQKMPKPSKRIRAAWLILSSSCPKEALAHMWYRLFKMHHLRCCPPLPCWPTGGGIRLELAGVICYLGGVVKQSHDISAPFLCFHSFFFRHAY